MSELRFWARIDRERVAISISDLNGLHFAAVMDADRAKAFAEDILAKVASLPRVATPADLGLAA